MGMKISELITDKYKLRIPPTVYYDLLADVVEVEEEQEPTTKNDLGVDKPTIIDWNNCHTSEQLDSIVTTKDDLAVDCISKENALRVANNEYLRGFHNALCKALNETYSIHCDEGHFRVVQEETLTGLGMSMESALGPDAESFMNTLPSVTPQEPRKDYLSIDDVMSVFDDFMCGEVDEDGTNTFLEMLRDKAESEPQESEDNNG